MDLPTLQEFESELISQGYSRSYARRFANELLDHSLELQQDRLDTSQPANDTVSIPRQVGSVQVLSESLNRYEELDPVPRKYPFICFVLVPAIILNLWICFGLYWVYELAVANQQSQRVFAVNFTNAIYYLFLGLLPIAGTWASNRYRVSKWYVGLLTLGLAMSSLFGTSVATCQNSQSAFIHSNWSFRWWQFLLPMAAMVVSHLTLSSTQRVKRFAWRNARNRRSSDPAWLAVNVMLFSIVLTVSGYLISGSIESLRKHPIDSLVTGFNAPASQTRRYLSVLQTPENPLESPMREKIDQRIVQYQTDLEELFATLDSSDKESWKRVNAASAELANQTYEEISSKLSSEQSDRIVRLGLKQQGWSAMFDPSVRQQLDVSSYQFQRFKDVHLESIKENQILNKQWRDAAESDKPAIVKKIEESRSHTGAKYAAILSEKQIKTMDQKYGTDLHRKYYAQKLPIVQNR